jgi:hypothetical protein
VCIVKGSVVAALLSISDDERPLQGTSAGVEFCGSSLCLFRLDRLAL